MAARYIERFACVANERASPCINPNLSTLGTSSDGAAASFHVGSYFCLSPRVLAFFRTTIAYDLRARRNGEADGAKE